MNESQVTLHRGGHLTLMARLLYACFQAYYLNDTEPSPVSINAISRRHFRAAKSPNISSIHETILNSDHYLNCTREIVSIQGTSDQRLSDSISLSNDHPEDPHCWRRYTLQLRDLVHTSKFKR